MVESVEGETEEKESEEAMDTKGALERLENFKDIALEKLKDISELSTFRLKFFPSKNHAS